MKRTQEVGTQEIVVREEMILPEEKPTELQLLMKMFSMDRHERIERDQRMDSMMKHFFASQSNLSDFFGSRVAKSTPSHNTSQFWDIC
jgi:hypothetical protein